MGEGQPPASDRRPFLDIVSFCVNGRAGWVGQEDAMLWKVWSLVAFPGSTINRQSQSFRRIVRVLKSILTEVS